MKIPKDMAEWPCNRFDGIGDCLVPRVVTYHEQIQVHIVFTPLVNVLLISVLLSYRKTMNDHLYSSTLMVLPGNLITCV